MEELKLTRKQKNLYDNGFGNNFLGQETDYKHSRQQQQNRYVDTLNIIKIFLYIKGNSQSGKKTQGIGENI